MSKKAFGEKTNNLTIREKEHNFIVSTIIEMIFTIIFLTYVLASFQAYNEQNPRVDFIEKFSGTLSTIVKDPIYFIHHPIKDWSLVLGITAVVVFIEFAMASFQRLKIHHDLNTAKGTTHWANVRELCAKYAEVINQKKGLFGFLKKKNEASVAAVNKAYKNVPFSKNMWASLDTRKHFHALNTLILGATGSGKSRFFLKPNILQMNASYIVTDPKGEILASCGETLRRNGYNIKVFDIVEMGNCDMYNPLKYCRQESDIKKIAQSFIKNTDATGGKGGGNKDPFWDDSMNAFMCACIGLLCTCPEDSNIPYSQITEITGGNVYNPVFANLCEFTRMANRKWTPNSGIAKLEGAELGDGKNNTANASELSQIFENLRIWEAKRQDTDIATMTKPYVLQEWDNFKIAPEKTSTTILMTTAVRMDAFNIEQVRSLTDNDTIDLDSIATQKTALFVIIPPTDRTYNFLCAFLYTQLFDLLYYFGSHKIAGSKSLYLSSGEFIKYFSKEDCDNGTAGKVTTAIKNAFIREVQGGSTYTGYEKVKTKHFFGLIKSETKKKVTLTDNYYEIVYKLGEEEIVLSARPTKALAEKFLTELQNAQLKSGSEPALPLHVRFLLDEFPNIGEIPEFKEKLATMRGYEISATVICQSITQLKGMYPDDYETIDNNCPFCVFLGGAENSNNEYLAKKAGDATIKISSASVDQGKNSVNGSYQIDSRQLLKPEEFGRLDYQEQVVFIYGEQPIKDIKFDYPAHRNYKYTNDYAKDIGAPEAYVFHRNYDDFEHLPLVFKPELAVAVPQIGTLNIEVLKNCLRKPSENAIINDYTSQAGERKSFNENTVIATSVATEIG